MSFQTLLFFQDVSDRIDKESEESKLLKLLQKDSIPVVGEDWKVHLGREFQQGEYKERDWELRGLLINSFYPCSILKCYYDEKMLFSFSLDSGFIFGKNSPCQLLRLNFQSKSDFFNYDCCSSRVALRELDRERK